MLIALVRDVTEREAAAQALRDSELRFRTLVEQAGDAFFVLDLDAVILDVNMQACRGLGYEREELIGRNIFEIETTGTAESLAPTLRQLMRGDAITLEACQRRKDGTLIPVEVRASMCQLEGRQVILCLVRDITERVRAAEALRDSEERFRLFMDHTPADAWIKDEEGRYLYCNRTALARHAKTLADVIGHTDHDIWPAERAESFRTADRGVLATGEVLDYSDYEPTPDEKPAHVRKLKFLLTDSAGRRYVGGLTMDVTAEYEARQALERLNAELESRVAARTAALTASNQELEAFSYSVSHDLRAPLRAIDGFARCLAESAGDKLDETCHDYLRRVQNGAGRMGELIDDLLALSRITRANFEKGPVDAAALARGVLDELALRDPERRVEVRIGGPCEVWADARLLRVLLVNLLGNAWKFTSKQPDARIEFECESNGAGSTICHVRDNGAGFDMRYAAKLFTAFQRLHSTREFPGSGIGLAIVQRIVNRHGGRIWASGAVDGGATFSFELPGRDASDKATRAE
jgi:PAS domain S-box-containing protein